MEKENLSPLILSKEGKTIKGVRNRVIKSISIPNGIVNIENAAFRGCSNLEYVTIPNGVTSIGERAFENCFSLSSIIIPQSVISIGNLAFIGCTSMASIKVIFNNNVFDSRDNCNAIIETASNTLIVGCKNTIIPNGVTSIGNWAFTGCEKLISAIIPSSVTYIGEEAYAGTSELSYIKVDEKNATFDSRDNCNAIIETASNTLIVGCKNTIIPNSVNSIGNMAFSACTNLTYITIPNSVTNIGMFGFYVCI